MLSLDADLEADLGIDSIKRVEISGTVVRSLDLPPDRTPDFERLTGSRTLRQVIENLESLIARRRGRPRVVDVNRTARRPIASLLKVRGPAPASAGSR